jgi:hypothetical protein
MRDRVWVFHGEGARQACAVFRTKEAAEVWIALAKVSGLLTAYPLDASAFDWAVSTGAFKPKGGESDSPTFVQRFTSASQEHYHFENGRNAAGS